jgi:hypothetical protein
VPASLQIEAALFLYLLPDTVQHVRLVITDRPNWPARGSRILLSVFSDTGRLDQNFVGFTSSFEHEASKIMRKLRLEESSTHVDVCADAACTLRSKNITQDAANGRSWRLGVQMAGAEASNPRRRLYICETIYLNIHTSPEPPHQN